jgi:peptidoglycan-N-acetylglucosamine deacetylase
MIMIKNTNLDTAITTVTRRRFMALTGLGIAALGLGAYAGEIQYDGPKIAITMDDPNLDQFPLLTPDKRNQAILDAFAKHDNLKAALFVCGMRVDNPDGQKLIKQWHDSGHLIGNHSYSHKFYGSPKVTADAYFEDILKGEKVIGEHMGTPKLFRFPFLKEGETAEKRDSMRRMLAEHGYRNGHVTIDASDWYVNSRMIDRIKKEPQADLTPYRDFYCEHIWDRVTFYNDLALRLLERPIMHTLLIHHNLLNALFLGDLFDFLKSKGCQLIDAAKAFSDSIFLRQPDIIPAGESLIWAFAKETGKYNDILRYPGEDGEYEKDKMDTRGL